MDELLVALGVAIPLVMALAWAIWWLIASTRRDRGCVAELLETAGERGAGLRLNWPEEDLDEAGRVRPYAQDQFPTTILPKVQDDGGITDSIG